MMDVESGLQDEQATIKNLQGGRQTFLMKTLGCVCIQLFVTTFIVAACYSS